MEDVILKFENVGKLYRLGNIGLKSLSADVFRWWQMNILRHEDPYLKIGETNDRTKKGKSNVIWALKDISFEVNRGEVIGIIGKNGAGKSTLLKLLSRITAPSSGLIKTKGKIASLLEIGTGFHYDLSGRENIYMNGSILGMTKKEIDRKFDEIVDFAGVERYIDTPIKRYSSGMIVRLGFAVAAFLEPDILVVDEVLAVGDAEFQKKAIGKMQNISTGEGRTVLFVSHNMASVKSLCSRGVVLDKGSLAFDGSIVDAVEHYLRFDDDIIKDKIINKIKSKSHFLEINKILINGTENRSSVIKSGQEVLNLIIEGHTFEKFNTDLFLIIKNRQGIPMASFVDGHVKGRIEHISQGDFRIERNIRLPKFLSTGEYIIDLFLHHPMVEYHMKAPDCAELIIEGYVEEGGRALKLNKEGFLGLESI